MVCRKKELIFAPGTPEEYKNTARACYGFRSAHRISVARMAELCEVRLSTINNIENGNSVGFLCRKILNFINQAEKDINPETWRKSQSESLFDDDSESFDKEKFIKEKLIKVKELRDRILAGISDAQQAAETLEALETGKLQTSRCALAHVRQYLRLAYTIADYNLLVIEGQV